MPQNYAIIRQTKVKGAKQSNALSNHNTRKIITSNIDRSKSHKNIVLKPSPYQAYDDFVFRKKKQIKEHNKKNGTKNRFVQKREDKKTKKKEYLAMSQEFIFTHSPNALNEMKSIEYLKCADRFIREWFQNCEIISSIIHLDEETPHIHIEASYFDMVRNKFIQKELYEHGKTDIKKIRDAFQKEVADEFGLKKQDGSVVNHHEYHADKEKGEMRRIINEHEHTIMFQGHIIKEQLEPKVIQARDARDKAKEQVSEIRQELDDLREDLFKIHGKGWKTIVKAKAESTRIKNSDGPNNSSNNLSI